MTKRTLEMSHQEIDRVGIVESVESKKLSQIERAKQLNISSRQMRRLQKRYQASPEVIIYAMQCALPTQQSRKQTK